MRIKTIVGPLLVFILIISPMFAVRGGHGRNPTYKGFSCLPSGPLKVGVPIPLELITIQNEVLKNAGVGHLNVSVWTYGSIEYRGPMSFEIDLNDSIPTVFPFTVIVPPIVTPPDTVEDLTFAGLTFTLTFDQLEMTIHSYFAQSTDTLVHMRGSPRIASWARHGVPEWAKRGPSISEAYSVDRLTGKRTKFHSTGPRTAQPTKPPPPDGYTSITILSKEEVARSEMRKKEMYPLVDEERQLMEIGGVWYVRDRGETKFRLAEVITNMEEHLTNRRKERLRSKSRVILDLRDSVAYRNAITIIGKDKLELTDSAGFYEATISGAQNIKLQEVGVKALRIKEEQKPGLENESSLLPKGNLELGGTLTPTEANRADIFFEGFETWSSGRVARLSGGII